MDDTAPDAPLPDAQLPDTPPSGGLIGLLIAAVVTVGSNALLLSPILIDVARDFGTDTVTIARVISAYGAATAISALFLSTAVDRFGARPVLVATTAVMALALAASAAAPAWPVLAAAQMLAGITAGMLLPAIYATATSLGGAARGARVLGRVLNGWAISLVAGVPASAAITDLAGWRVAYVVLAAIAAATCLGCRRLPPAPARDRAGPMRHRVASPLATLRRPGVASLLVVCLTFMSAFYGCYAFVGDAFRRALDLDAGTAGLFVLAYGAGFGLASLAAPLIDRIGPARLLPRVMVAIAGVYLILDPALHGFPTALAVAAIWGMVNHLGLNMLVLLLSRRAAGAGGAVMGLHSAVTYTAVFLGPLLLGLAYEGIGFGAVAGAAAAAALIGAGAAWRDARRWPG